MAAAILTQARLKEVLSYNPATGIFIWLASRSRRVKNGAVAGCTRKDGYVLVYVDGKLHYAHRLAWLYVTGAWPTVLIDHRDLDPSNNAWSNLREATYGENFQNKRKAQANSTSGLIGAHWAANDNKWFSRITVDGKTTALGRFDTPEEAHAAYVAAKRKLHPFGNL
jgi:hypothetical protein